ncbi:MAG: hypothetical protein ABSF71_12730 [Terriglobia bacterium]
MVPASLIMHSRHVNLSTTGNPYPDGRSRCPFPAVRRVLDCAAPVRLTSAMAALLAVLAGTNAYPAGCDGLVGTWNWFTGSVVTFRADHAILYDGNQAGKWECTDAAHGSAKLRWNAGYIDTVTLSGDRISGVNQQGVPVSGTRKPAAPPSRHSPKPASTTTTAATTKPPQPVTPAGPLQTGDTAPLDPRLAAGRCVIDKDNYQQAIAFLNATISRNPKDAEALYYRGRCWHYAKQEQRAVQDLNASLAIDPHNSWAYLYRGRALEASGATNNQIAADFTRAQSSMFRCSPRGASRRTKICREPSPSSRAIRRRTLCGRSYNWTTTNPRGRWRIWIRLRRSTLPIPTLIAATAWLAGLRANSRREFNY